METYGNYMISLYSNIKSVVKWRGELSEPFDEKQGGTSSADKYKSGKNKLLHHLDSVYSNDIGHLHTGALMVADDLTLTLALSMICQLASPSQSMMHLESATHSILIKQI